MPETPTRAARKLANRFEKAIAAGDRPDIAEYLAELPAERGWMLRELVHAELELLPRRGIAACLAEYLIRFPDLGHDSEVVAELLLTELNARGRDAPPVRAEYDAAYPAFAAAVAAAFARWEVAAVRLPGYEVLARLGQGGMGVVYKARDLGLNRVVALKMILRAEHATAPDRERFLREAQAAAALRHPNVVQVYEVGEHGGLPYFTMEFVPGGSLADRAADGPLLPQLAAEFVEQIARGVAFAHRNGIVHRDLKLGNILVTDRHETAADDPPKPAGIKIADFGLAKRLDLGDNLTGSRGLIGTPEYMAPEQARGVSRGVGPAADVWGVGAILYRLLTGRPPFQSGAPLETIRLVLETEPVTPGDLVGRMPKDLETVCMQCLRKDPGRRYVTADELADDLRRWLDGKPVVARPVGSIERSWKWVKRNRSVSAATFAVVLALSAATGVSLSQANRAERERKNAETQTGIAQRNETEANKAKDAEREKTAEVARRALELEAFLAVRNLRVAGLELADRPVDDPAGADGHFRRANDALDAVPPGRRCLVWNYLRRRALGDGVPLYGHTSEVRGVAWSRDGTRVASVSDAELIVWDADDGRELVRTPVAGLGTNPAGLPFHRTPWDAPTSLCFAPDGVRVCWHERDRVRSVDLRLGNAISVLTHPNTIGGIALSPDGSLLAVGSADKPFQPVGAPPRAWTAAALYRADGGLVARFGGDDMSRFGGLAFTPDGSRVVARYLRRSPQPDGAIHFQTEVGVWNTGGTAVRTIKGNEPGGLHAALPTADAGTVLGAHSTGGYRAYSLATGEATNETYATADGQTLAALSPNGVDVAWVRWRPGGSVVNVQERGLGVHVRAIFSDVVSAVAFSPTGLRFAAAGGVAVRLHGLPRDRTFGSHTPGPTHSAAFTADGSCVLEDKGDAVRAWDVRTGRYVWTAPPVVQFPVYADGIMSGPGQVRSLPVAGSHVLIRTPAAWEVWDVRTAWRVWTRDCPLPPTQHDRLVWFGLPRAMVHVTPAGVPVLVESLTEWGGGKIAIPARYPVRVSDLRTGRELATADLGPELINRPDGSLGRMFGAVNPRPDGGLELVAVTGAVVVLPPGGRPVWVRSDAEGERSLLPLSRQTSGLRIDQSSDLDGRGSMMGTAQVSRFENRNWVRVARLVGHTAGVTQAAASRDGARIFTASHDRTVRAWAADTGDELATIRFAHAPTGLALAPDDGHLVVSFLSQQSYTLLDLRPVGFADGSVVVPPEVSATGGFGISPRGDRLLLPVRRRLAPSHGAKPARPEDALALQVVSIGGPRPATVGDPFPCVDFRHGEVGGRQLLAASGMDDTNVWDIDAGRRLWSSREAGYGFVLDATFVPGNDRVVLGGGTGSDLTDVRGPGYVVLAEATTGRMAAKAGGHGGAVGAVAVSPDGRLAASVSADDATVVLWDAADLRELHRSNFVPPNVPKVVGAPAHVQLVFGPEPQRLRLVMHTGHSSAPAGWSWDVVGTELRPRPSDDTPPAFDFRGSVLSMQSVLFRDSGRRLFHLDGDRLHRIDREAARADQVSALRAQAEANAASLRDLARHYLDIRRADGVGFILDLAGDAEWRAQLVAERAQDGANPVAAVFAVREHARGKHARPQPEVRVAFRRAIDDRDTRRLALRTAVVVPDAIDDWPTLVPLAEELARSGWAEDRLTLGGVLLRSGKVADAKSILELLSKSPDELTAHLAAALLGIASPKTDVVAKLLAVSPWPWHNTTVALARSEPPAPDAIRWRVRWRDRADLIVVRAELARLRE